MKNATIKKSIALVTLLASLTFSILAQEVDLRYRLKPGMAYSTETTLHTSMIQKVMGIDQEIIMDMVTGLDGKVTANHKGIYTIEYRYRHLRIATRSAMFAVDIDTDGPATPQNQMMKVLIGKPFTVEMDEQGKITSVSGLEQMISDIDTLSDVDAATREQYKASLQETFGKESFLQTMNQESVLYPGHPVKTGDSWNYRYSTTSNNIMLNLQNVATLKEASHHYALIRINSLIATPANDSISLGGNSGKISMTGTQISEVRIDPATGLIMEGNVSQDIRGRLILSDLPDSDEPMEIPMTMTSKIEVTLTLK